MKSWRRQKVGAGAGESPYCKARQIRSFWLLSGPTEDPLLLPDDGVALCAFSRQVKHCLHLPCFYGLIFAKLCSLYRCSQASYQNVVKTQMLTITVQYQFLYSWPPNQRLS
jgi:hypothetical protein